MADSELVASFAAIAFAFAKCVLENGSFVDLLSFLRKTLNSAKCHAKTDKTATVCANFRRSEVGFRVVFEFEFESETLCGFGFLWLWFGCVCLVVGDRCAKIVSNSPPLKRRKKRLRLQLPLPLQLPNQQKKRR